ncbi:MAG: hypothetical protein IJ190_13125 [Prevotella sp.]|nr:hypothetical protein [Prevotella sp.]
MGKYLIIWTAKARHQYIQHLIYAQQEFGNKAFYGWVHCVKEMENRLREYPKSYGILRQFKGKHQYRGHIVIKNFKIIYAIDERRQTVRIVAIWDMRMNPQKLSNFLT